MDNNVFYGTEKSSTVTYLEFGEIDLERGAKKIWDFRLHQKAYDWLMMGRYSNDIYTFISMSERLDKVPLNEIVNTYLQEIHHKGELFLSLKKLLALAVCSDKENALSFFELGQTLFGCIEGMGFCTNLLKCLKVSHPIINLQQIQWYGTDISELFNKMSLLLHQKYKVVTMSNTELLQNKVDIFFSKGITLLYAVRNYNQLYHLLNLGRCAIFDYSFSIEGDQFTTIGSGKTVKYLDYRKFQETLDKGTKKYFVLKSQSNYNPNTKRIFVESIYADENICNEFIANYNNVRSQLKKASLSFPAINQLFDLENEETPAWVTLEEFVSAMV